jgi:hypothetical protein
MLLGDFFETEQFTNPRIVHQHLHRAEPPLSLLEKSRHGRLFSDVRLDRQRLSTFRADFAHDPLGLHFSGAIIHDDGCSSPGQVARDRGADPAGGPRHDRDFSLETSGHGIERDSFLPGDELPVKQTRSPEYVPQSPGLLQRPVEQRAVLGVWARLGSGTATTENREAEENKTSSHEYGEVEKGV